MQSRPALSSEAAPATDRATGAPAEDRVRPEVAVRPLTGWRIGPRAGMVPLERRDAGATGMDEERTSPLQWGFAVVVGGFAQAVATGGLAFFASVFFSPAFHSLAGGVVLPFGAYFVALGAGMLGALTFGRSAPGAGAFRGSAAFGWMLGLGEAAGLDLLQWNATPAVTLLGLVSGGLLFTLVAGAVGVHMARHDLQAWWHDEIDEFLESIGLAPRFGDATPSDDDDADG
ncbi:MAG: hypothetical protein ACOCX4_03675 [Planctomycetota bacterium]